MNRFVRQWTLVSMASMTLLALGSAGLAEPGGGIRYGGWTISPFAGLSATYDSNVLLFDRGAMDDVFVETSVGLVIGRTTDSLSVDAQLAAVRRAYADLSQLDSTSFGDAIRVTYVCPGGATIRCDQRFRRVHDTDISDYSPSCDDASSAGPASSILTAAARTDRDLHNAGIALAKQVSDKSGIGLTYAFAMVDYDKPEFFDSADHVFLGECAYQITDKSAATLAVEYDVEDSNAFDGFAKLVSARVGVASRGTDKVRYKLGLGSQTYMRPDGAGDNVDGLSARASASWQVTDKAAIQVVGRNDMLASSIYENNVRTISSASVGAAYRPVAAVLTQLGASFGREKHEDPVQINSVSITRKDEVSTIDARVSYAPPANLFTFVVNVSYAMANSNVEDYKEVRVGAGIDFRY